MKGYKINCLLFNKTTKIMLSASSKRYFCFLRADLPNLKQI